uniref:Uncharacterized protein n=1 Tax=Musa acuminata subsp. malaccensis TaxID=214687 RepID=A0A804I181_MUSAM|nr:PREDICTED: DNA-directed RNA polymerase II subunit RPB1-like [Musa acuminata subsp. malaccensis]
MEDCHDLQNRSEDFIRKGYLGRYLEKPQESTPHHRGPIERRRPSTCPSLSRSVLDLRLAIPTLAQASPDRLPTYSPRAQLLSEPLQIGSQPAARWQSSFPSLSRSVPDLQPVGPAIVRASPDRFPTYSPQAQLLPEPLQIGSRPAACRPSYCLSLSRSIPDLHPVSPTLARASPDRFPTCSPQAQLLPEPLQIGSRPIARRPSSCPSLSRSVPDLRPTGPTLVRASPNWFPTYSP